MLPDRVSSPGPLTYESGALPIALRGPALDNKESGQISLLTNCIHITCRISLFVCAEINQANGMREQKIKKKNNRSAQIIRLLI